MPTDTRIECDLRSAQNQPHQQHSGLQSSIESRRLVVFTYMTASDPEQRKRDLRTNEARITTRHGCWRKSLLIPPRRVNAIANCNGNNVSHVCLRN